jgi:hypothetical protein
VLAATVALNLSGCANTGAFCENQPWVCGLVAVGAIAGVIVATGIFEGAPDSPDPGPEFPTVSDARLKRDVRPVAMLPNGLQTYAFRYWNDERVFVGVMAQDLLADPRHAHAVQVVDGRYFAVDLAALGLVVAGDASQFAEAGRHALEGAPGSRTE